MPHLLNAAGDEVPTDTCSCGRPKELGAERCCPGCRGNYGGPHLSACHMRLAVLGVPGFTLEVL